MDLNEIAIFARVVQAQSFTAAGRDLGLPKSTVSRKVAELEERLGTRLLHRTTRSLGLTDAGRAYFGYAARIVTEVEEADLAVTTMQGAPRGLLRVTAPLAFDVLGSLVSSYLARYPEVQVQLVCTDRVVDIVEEGFDLAVRAGRLADSSLMVRHLGAGHSVVVASPALLAEQGAVKRPTDLERLPAIVFGGSPNASRWKLLRKSEAVTVAVRPRLVTNDFGVLQEAALGGVGVALLPTLRCEQAIRAGRLRAVLPAWRSEDIPIQAVYPSTRQLSPKVKTFIDHLHEGTASVFPRGK